MIENAIEEKIIESLNDEPKSTRGLMRDVVDLVDRAETSLLLHEMSKRKLIWKQSNGYWKVCAETTQPAKEVEPVEESSIEDIPVFTKRTGPAITPIEKPIVTEPKPQPKGNAWEVIKDIEQIIPDGVRLSIESGAIIVEFAGRLFRASEDGDIEALFRVATLRTDKAA